jgi:hypothetical protein
MKTAYEMAREAGVKLMVNGEERRVKDCTYCCKPSPITERDTERSVLTYVCPPCKKSEKERENREKGVSDG